MDWLSVVRPVVFIVILALGVSGTVEAQQFSPSPASSRPAAQARMRPLGAPSAVDSFAPAPSMQNAAGASIQRVTMLQIPVDSQPMAPPSLPGNGFAFPNNAQPLPNNLAPAPSTGGFGLPSNNGLPVPLQSSNPSGPIAPPPSLQPQPGSVPIVTTPVSPAPLPASPRVVPSPGLPINPNVSSQPLPSNAAPIMVGPNSPVPRISTPSNGTPGTFGPIVVNPPSASDYAAIPQPQLDNAFATMDNCRNVTGPSSYRAAGFFGCDQPAAYTSPVYGPPVYGAPTTYVPPPSQVAPAVALPPGATYSPVSLTGSVPPVIPGSPGFRPLFTLGQERNPVQVGQGFWGQPVAYVPGQTIRNGLRYISF